MPVLELDFIEAKVHQGASALRAIPRIAEQYSADVPEDCADPGQETRISRRIGPNRVQSVIAKRIA